MIPNYSKQHYCHTQHNNNNSNNSKTLNIPSVSVSHHLTRKEPLGTLLISVLLLILTLSSSHVSAMDLFNVKYVETSDSRLIATSNYNYALFSPKLAARNWKTISVNGDVASIVTLGGEKLIKNRNELDRSFVEDLRDELANTANANSYTSSIGGMGGGGFMMSSSNNGGFSSSSFSSSSGTGAGGSFMSSTQGGGGTSVQMRDENNFSISKTNFPFQWSKLFFNNDLVTIVYRNGEVQMRPITYFEPNELEVINKAKLEAKGAQGASMQQATSMISNTMGSVSNLLNGIMGSLPKPPDFSSSTGGMFGNNFPFGNNNSPFGSGWPFSGGAFAFGRRR